jgi:hypothetical protein
METHHRPVKIKIHPAAMEAPLGAIEAHSGAMSNRG